MALTSSHRVHQWISDLVQGSCLLLLLLVSNLLLCQGENFPPICRNKSGKCRIPLQSLFDRATTVANYNYRIAGEMFSEFDKQYGQSKNFASEVLNICPTKFFTTTDNKEDAENIQDEVLFKMVVSLLHSWDEPLHDLVTKLLQSKEVSPDLLAKVAEMEDKTKVLREGVEELQKRIHPGEEKEKEKEKETETSPVWSEKSYLTADDDDVRQTAFYKMFHCLHEDSSKINTFLQMLKCRYTSCEAHN